MRLSPPWGEKKSRSKEALSPRGGRAARAAVGNHASGSLGRTRMRIVLVTLLCIFVLTASGATSAGAGDKADVEKELKKFQGTWTVELVQAEGKEIPIDNFKGMTVTFERDKYTVRIGDMVIQKAIQKLDPSKSPKAMDGTVAEGPHKGTVILGIYEISDDTLKVCFDPEGKQRPTAFKTAAGSQTTLAVYKRVK
jgi:uncharacterized protein (TIGR03067 family)